MMVKKPTYRFLSFGLAFLILCSSLGITIDFHYCGGELQTIALFGKAETCHQKEARLSKKSCCAKKAKACHFAKKSTEGISKSCTKDCCKDKMVQVLLDADLPFSYSVELSDIQRLVLGFVPTVYKGFTPNKTAKFSFPYYRPPPLYADIFIRIQCFRL